MRTSLQLSVSREWRTNVVTGLEWEQDANRTAAPGEAGGFFVRTNPALYSGYLKPTKQCPDNHPRAANEKIVADLAHDVGVFIPPVQLYRRNPCPQGEEPRTCVSLIMYEELHEWGHVWGVVGPGPIPAIVRTSLARESGIIALDAYIGNTDRNNNRNAGFGVDATAQAGGRFVFLDSANSLNMSDRWNGNAWSAVDVPPMPDVLRQAVDPAVLKEAIDRIEAITDETIGNVVARIPDDYMTPAHKAAVKAGLKGRRSLIRPILTRQFNL